MPLSSHEPCSSADEVPPHPGQNRKEITCFIIIVLLSVGGWYGLARIPRYETAALYVLGLGPLLGTFGLSVFRVVRCPCCRKTMDRVRAQTVAGKAWGVFRCEQCHGEWRVEESDSTGV